MAEENIMCMDLDEITDPGEIGDDFNLIFVDPDDPSHGPSGTMKRAKRMVVIGEASPQELGQLKGVLVGGNNPGDIVTIGGVQVLSNKSFTDDVSIEGTLTVAGIIGGPIRLEVLTPADPTNTLYFDSTDLFWDGRKVLLETV